MSRLPRRCLPSHKIGLVVFRGRLQVNLSLKLGFLKKSLMFPLGVPFALGPGRLGAVLHRARAHWLRAGFFKGIGFLPHLHCEMERTAFVKGIFRCGLLGGILGGHSCLPGPPGPLST